MKSFGGEGLGHVCLEIKNKDNEEKKLRDWSEKEFGDVVKKKTK